MSVNKYMHPRNIYKTPPNFKQLAIQYPEFLKYIKQEISGKVSVDFKDKETLRALTATLLKKDFGLAVEIPQNHLIPTLPLRLNYLLWIEDLLNFHRNEEKRVIKGIDIGTGASCVYPLLAAKTNNWHMIATDVDEENIEIAKRNVEKNNLLDVINVKLIQSDTILKDAIESEESYDFCMCNPPFFSSEEELDPRNKSRSEKRSLPRNVQTGMCNEVIVPGGEVGFVSKLIDESAELKSQVRIYTSMVGHKSSLKPLKEQLHKINVSNWIQTEFCQGHTTRWGLAWTFDSRTQLENYTSNQSRKKAKPLTFIIPNSNNFSVYDMELVLSKVRTVLNTLEIQYKTLKSHPNLHAFEIVAGSNTWSHQRRQRRQKINQLKEENTNVESNSLDVQDSNDDAITALTKPPESISSSKREREESSSNFYESESKKQKIATEQTICNVTSPESSVQYFLKASLIVKNQDSVISLELLYIDGPGGKEAANQVLQYFKNNLK